MTLYVVDPSVAAKWFIEEEYAQAALSLLAARHALHAPDFFLLEMDSVFCKWIRRGIITASEGEDIRVAVRGIPMQLHPFGIVQDPAYAIASQTGRSPYDCLYVALAMLLQAKLVTADRRLYDALAAGRFKKYALWIEHVR